MIREENNNEKGFSFAFHDSGTRHKSAGEPWPGVTEPAPASNLLSDLRQITSPFWAAGVSSVKRGRWTK